MHAAIIKDLGDTAAVARELRQSDSTVSMWKRRGVPWRWRPAIADLARARGLDLPDDFLNPQGEAA